MKFLLSIRVIERFVNKVIVKQDTIELEAMVTVHTTGGGGAYRAITRILKSNAL